MIKIKLPKIIVKKTEALNTRGKEEYWLNYMIHSDRTHYNRSLTFKVNSEDKALEKMFKIIKESARHASKDSRYLVFLFPPSKNLADLYRNKQAYHSPKEILKVTDPKTMFVKGYGTKALEQIAGDN